jgi:hypothetical protein
MDGTADMNKLTSLHTFIDGLKLVNSNQIYSVVTHSEVKANVVARGNGIKIARCRYDATIDIEGLRIKDTTATGAGYYLMAQLAVWLLNEDPYRVDIGLADPAIDIVDMGASNKPVFDVTINITLEDDLELIQDDAGPIAFKGQQWRLDGVPVWIAETGSIMDYNNTEQSLSGTNNPSTQPGGGG